MLSDDNSAIEAMYSKTLHEVMKQSETRLTTSDSRIDELSTVLIPDDVPEKVQLKALKTRGNGDCLFNACSIAIAGTHLLIVIRQLAYLGVMERTGVNLMLF